jgi:hypothetical protein
MFMADLQHSSTAGTSNRAIADDTAKGGSLYLWDEQSDYARLPKSLASRLTFSEFEMQPRGKGNPERVQRPTVAADGTPSPVLLDALGLTGDEAQRLTDAMRATFADFSTYAAGRGYVTNLDFSMEANSERQTWFTPAFPEEGRQFRERLRNSLVQLMGEERTETFWQQAEGVFRDSLNEFGQAPKAVTVAHWTRGGVGIGEMYFHPDGSPRWNRSDPRVNVPDALKAYLEAWKQPIESQNKANQK